MKIVFNFLKNKTMVDKGNGEMHMNAYTFMGLHMFWWVSILIFALILLALAHRYRKRK